MKTIALLTCIVVVAIALQFIVRLALGYAYDKIKNKHVTKNTVIMFAAEHGILKEVEDLANQYISEGMTEGTAYILAYNKIRYE